MTAAKSTVESDETDPTSGAKSEQLFGSLVLATSWFRSKVQGENQFFFLFRIVRMLNDFEIGEATPSVKRASASKWLIINKLAKRAN